MLRHHYEYLSEIRMTLLPTYNFPSMLSIDLAKADAVKTLVSGICDSAPCVVISTSSMVPSSLICIFSAQTRLLYTLLCVDL